MVSGRFYAQKEGCVGVRKMPVQDGAANVEISAQLL